MRLIRRSTPLLALFLAACPQQVPVDLGRAELMPESVARRVVERYLTSNWLDRPYLDLLACFRTGVQYVSMGEIRGAWYVAEERAYYISNFSEIVLGCDNASLRVRNVSQEEARELTAALVSLGATIRPTR
jgi:hypothetical protein